MSDWTAEREKLLRDQWNAGISSGVIAQRLGTTRSKVCGKARRLGLAQRVRTDPIVRKGYDNRRRAAVAKAKPSRPRPVKPKPVASQPLFKALLELQPGECRWPFGNGPFVFCAVPAASGPYCACHTRQAYQPGTWQPTRGHYRGKGAAA